MGEGQEEERLNLGVCEKFEDHELGKTTASLEEKRRETQREDSKRESFGVFKECPQT